MAIDALHAQGCYKNRKIISIDVNLVVFCPDYVDTKKKINVIPYRIFYSKLSII